MHARFWFGGFVAAIIVCSTQFASAAPTPEQSAKAKEVASKLKKAGNLFTRKQTAEAAAAVREAQAELASLVAEAKPVDAIALGKPLIANLKKARELLSLHGESFEPLPTLPDPTAKPAEGAKPAGGAVVAGQVSFMKQVAPVLMSKCGGCHTNESKGGLNVSTFAGIEKGSKEGGAIVNPGSSQGSRMIEVIQSGDMPRGGKKIAPAELALLSKWIDEGAKFDGTDKSASIAMVAAAAPDMPAVKVAQATGNEKVLFARDIGPVLMQNCLGCHGAERPRAGLSFANFAALLKGGESGTILTPGKPAESLLIMKLRGTSGARMPLQKPALDDATIAKFEEWIASGAKFDGPDQNMSLTDVVQLLFAARATHEELSPERAKIAARTWRLTMPQDETNRHESDQFLVMGNMAEEYIAEVATAAEELAPKIGKMLGAPADQPLIKGRLTIFCFNKRFDYGEIGTMVEMREIPSNSKGHYRFTGIDAYVALLPPKPGEYPLPSLLSQQMAGAYVSSLGKVPTWFAEGTARTVASRIDPKDPRVKSWDGQLGDILSAAPKRDAFLTGGLGPEENEIVAYGFVKQLMANAPKFNAMLAAVRGGTSFDEAFAKNFGGTPSQLATRWTPKTSGRRR